MATVRTTGVEPFKGSAPRGSQSATEMILRGYGAPDIRINRPLVVPALTEAEALEWVKKWAPRLRGRTLRAVMFFLTNTWQLEPGWRIGIRVFNSYRSRLWIGPVGDRCSFKKSLCGYSACFSSAARMNVILLVHRRLLEVEAQS